MATKKTKDATKFKHSKVDELFNLVKLDANKRVIICVGNNKVSRKTFPTFAAADEYIQQKPYELLINVSILIQKMQQNENKQIEENTAKSAEDAQSN